MPAYKVVLPEGAYTVLDGNNSMIVFAGNATDAKAAADAHSDADGAPWLQATATELEENAVLAGLRVIITIAADDDNNFEEDVVITYDVPEGATTDTVDEIGAAIVVVMNATAELAGVTYTAGSDLITIVEANNCGLSDITATVSLLGGDGLTYIDVTSMALTVSAVGVDASSDRTITITALGSGVRPSVVTGFHTAL